MPLSTDPTVRRRLTQQRLAAYARLGVSPATVLSSPQCTPFFNEIGGVALVLQSLRLSPDPSARAFFSHYDRVSKTDRESLPIEAFCVAASVCPSRLAEVAVAAVAKNKVLHGAVIAALAHPAIMETNVRMAKTEEGLEDRSLHLKMVGAMPLPRTSQTVVNVNASASAASAANAAAQSAAITSPEDTIRKIVEARQRQQLTQSQQAALPEPADTAPSTIPAAFSRKPELVPIDAEYTEDED